MSNRVVPTPSKSANPPVIRRGATEATKAMVNCVAKTRPRSSTGVRSCKIVCAGTWVKEKLRPMRKALLPIITVIGLEAGHLLAGAVVTETVFALPGMGRLLVESVLGRDFPIVQGSTLVLVTLLVSCNLIADLLYAAADPRVSEA